jgi:putative flippase GtrA
MDGLIQRWIAFNGVGSLGIVVQLGVLAILVRHFDVPYLWATAVAVECAVLHNFLWHQRWTWRDRPSGRAGQIAGRLLRFHALNGFVSLVGNLAIARVMTGELHADPLASNIAAIIVCSIVNFAASELLVFRRAGAAVLVLLAASSASAATGPEWAELRAPALQAWAAYERQVDTRLQTASAASSPFFALDAHGIKDWRAAAMAGGVAMYRLDRPQPGGPTVSVPDGKIHHWAGAVFVPNMTVDALLRHLTTFAGRESEHYDDVVTSRLISRNGDSHKVFLKLRRTKVVTVTYNTEHTVDIRRLGPSRATLRSVSTRIAELADAGTPQEKEMPEGRDQGFLWRLNAYWRYEAVKGGVLVECESISLSRDVPALLKFFISGMVEGIARDSLEKTLVSLKRALMKTT